jgi:hypothetical protein
VSRASVERELPVPAEPVETAPAGGEHSMGGRVRPAALLAATGVALLVLGAVLGVLGAFLNDVVPRVLGIGLPVGPILAAVGNLTAGLLGTLGTGSRLGGALPGLGWFAVVAVLGSLRAEGDLIVPGDGRGVTFIVVGALAAGLALLPGAEKVRRRRLR